MRYLRFALCFTIFGLPIFGVLIFAPQALAQDSGLERLQKAAEAGNMDAQFDLGRRYYAGLGLGKDNQKAFEWFQKAANQGHVEAQGSVGLMYYLGWGVIRNRDKGCQALHYSAQRGSNIGITFYNKHCNPD